LNALTQQNYNIGRQNYWQAAGAENALAGQYGSAASSEGGLALNAGNEAWNQATGIQTAKQQQAQAIGASIGGIASAALPVIGGGIGALGAGEGFGQGAMDFLSGAGNEALGQNVFNVSGPSASTVPQVSDSTNPFGMGNIQNPFLSYGSGS
jgi:hypothetical protein